MNSQLIGEILANVIVFGIGVLLFRKVYYKYKQIKKEFTN